MDVKVIKPVDSTAKGASISKYASNREGAESGRRQQSSYGYKPKPEKKEAAGFDRFFASTAKSPGGEASDFALMLKKIWEDNARMQESAKASRLEGALLWGISMTAKK